MESSLLNRCCGLFVVFLVEYLLLSICCGTVCCGIFVVESLLWKLRSGIVVVGMCCLCCGIFCCGIFVVEYLLWNLLLWSLCGGAFVVESLLWIFV